MYTIEDFTNDYNKCKVKFFESRFVDKDFRMAIFEAAEDALKNLMAAQVNFILIKDCIEAIKTDENFWNKLDMDTKRIADEMVLALKEISKSLDEILAPIAEGFEK